MSVTSFFTAEQNDSHVFFNRQKYPKWSMHTLRLHQIYSSVSPSFAPRLLSLAPSLHLPLLTPAVHWSTLPMLIESKVKVALDTISFDERWVMIMKTGTFTFSYCHVTIRELSFCLANRLILTDVLNYDSCSVNLFLLVSDRWDTFTNGLAEWIR